MAAAGSTLATPEVGMTRFPSMNINFIYNGTFSVASATGYNIKYTDVIGDSIDIYFYGTKIYLLENRNTNRSNAIKCVVDDTDTYIASAYGSSAYCYVLFAIEDLEKGVHKITLINETTASTKRMGVQYVDTDGHICTEDGKYIDITPIMTSATAPSGHVASASTSYNSDYAAYKAFNGTAFHAEDAWAAANHVLTGWIQLDFGSRTKINAFIIRARLYTSNSEAYDIGCAPNTFQLLGSNDGVNYDILLAKEGVDNWERNVNRRFVLDKTYNYRYYKLNVDAVNGGLYLTISEMRFLLNKDTSFYLIEDNNVYKNIDYDNDQLVDVEDLSILSNSVFENNCICNINDILKYYNNFENVSLISNRSNSIVVDGYRSYREMMVMKNSFYSSNIKLINYLYSVSNINGVNNSIKFVISFDDGIVWKTFSDNIWNDLSIEIPIKSYDLLTDSELIKWNNAKDTIATNGVSAQDIETINFDDIDIEKIKIATVISITENNTEEVSLSSISCNADENDTLTELEDDSAQKIITKDSNTLIVKALKDIGTMYINVNSNGLEGEGELIYSDSEISDAIDAILSV